MLLSRNVTRHLGPVIVTARVTPIAAGLDHVRHALRCPCGTVCHSPELLAAHRKETK